MFSINRQLLKTRYNNRVILCSFINNVIVTKKKLNSGSRMATALLVIPACALAALLLWPTAAGVFISNLSEACYRCLCYVSTDCNTAHGCTAGYCGPFNISRVYWVDAGKVTLPDDDPNRNHAWEDCARSYHCSKRIVEGYLQRFGKDCNSDGVTDCFDYMMVNGNGGYGCTASLNDTANGRRWLRRYRDCQLNTANA